MTSLWKYVLNQTSVEALLTARVGQRNRLIHFLLALTNDPYKEGDFSAQDEVGRTVQIKVVGAYMVTYWSDHPVREVRVVNIERI